MIRASLLVLALGAIGYEAIAATGTILPTTPYQAQGLGLRAMTECPNPPTVCTWERTFGSPLSEKAYAIAEMHDGGFAVAGHSGRALGVGQGHDNGLIVRYDRAGKVKWRRIIGGRSTEQLYGIVALDDGGVAVAGHTHSKGSGQSDVWVVRLDAGGRLVWQRTFGGPANDRARTIAVVPSGGLIVAGFTRSKGAGDGDAWILRLDLDGQLLWDKVYGKQGDDAAFNVMPMPDGGFAVAGYSQTPAQNAYELWVLRISGEGRLRSERHFHRGIFAAATGLVPAPKGGLFVVGLSQESSAKQPNVWLSLLDRDNAIVWQKSLGGPKADSGWSIAATEDGGIVVLAATASRGAGSTDALLMRFDSTGRLLWEQSYGQALWDRPTALLVTRDGGLFVSGYTTSQGAGHEDFWLLRLDDKGRLDPAG